MFGKTFLLAGLIFIFCICPAYAGITVNDDFSIDLCAEYGEQTLGFTVALKPESLFGGPMLWKLDAESIVMSPADGEDCLELTDDLDLRICGDLLGSSYCFTLDFQENSADGEYLWALDISSLRQLIPVPEDLSLDFCASFQGEYYRLSMNSVASPVADDEGLYWELETLSGMGIPGTGCAEIGEDYAINISVAFNGETYDLNLDLVEIADRVFWKLRMP